MELPESKFALSEIMHAIDAKRGWELDLGVRVPFYAFVCVDLVTGMDDTKVSDTREFRVTIRARPHSGLGTGILAEMKFDYTHEGLADMLVWIEDQKMRTVCENATHDWCKLSLPDWHLCAYCTFKQCCLGNRSAAVQSGPPLGCAADEVQSVEMKPLV